MAAALGPPPLSARIPPLSRTELRVVPARATDRRPGYRTTTTGLRATPPAVRSRTK
jgi:hypothetical protein